MKTQRYFPRTHEPAKDCLILVWWKISPKSRKNGTLHLRGTFIFRTIDFRGKRMSQLISTRSVSAAALAAAFVAGLAVFLTPIAPQARAQARLGAGVTHAPSIKADRLPVRVNGGACSSHSWPNYDIACQFDLRRSADDIRVVRIVNLTKARSSAAE